MILCAGAGKGYGAGIRGSFGNVKESFCCIGQGIPSVDDWLNFAVLDKLSEKKQILAMDLAKQEGGTLIFTGMFQAHLPDADKPPLYIDLPAHQENGSLIIDSKLIDRFNMIKGTGFAGL